MKIYLDDIRNLPVWAREDTDWVVTRTVEETIDLLKTGEVTVIDLDHDLGTALDGEDVLKWIEKQFYTNPDFKLPEMYLHTANPVEYKAMQQAIDRMNNNG